MVNESLPPEMQTITRSPSEIMLKSAMALPVSLRSFLCILLRSSFSFAIVASFLRWPGILHALRASKKLIAPACLTLCALNAEAGVILLYHHVDVNTPAITSISPDQFDKHLAIIEKEGFRVLSLDTLIDNALNGDADVKEVAITFDDAYISIYRERNF